MSLLGCARGVRRRGLAEGTKAAPLTPATAALPRQGCTAHLYVNNIMMLGCTLRKI